MSNEIIRRCCEEINLEKIFDGYAQTGMKSLQDCIMCCEQWKDIYMKVPDSIPSSVMNPQPHCTIVHCKLKCLIVLLSSLSVDVWKFDWLKWWKKQSVVHVVYSDPWDHNWLFSCWFPFDFLSADIQTAPQVLSSGLGARQEQYLCASGCLCSTV